MPQPPLQKGKMHSVRSDSNSLDLSRHESSRGNPRHCRLTEDEAIGIFQCKGEKSNASRTARAYSVSEKTVRDIWTGRTWAKKTSCIDASRSLKVAQMGRPKGRRDTQPRKSRRESDSCRKESAKHHLGLAGRNENDDFSVNKNDHRISSFQSNRVGSLDLQLLAWERHHSKAPAFYDPFHQDLNSFAITFASDSAYDMLYFVRPN